MTAVAVSETRLTGVTAWQLPERIGRCRELEERQEKTEKEREKERGEERKEESETET